MVRHTQLERLNKCQYQRVKSPHQKSLHYKQQMSVRLMQITLLIKLCQLISLQGKSSANKVSEAVTHREFKGVRFPQLLKIECSLTGSITSIRGIDSTESFPFTKSILAGRYLKDRFSKHINLCALSLSFFSQRTL